MSRAVTLPLIVLAVALVAGCGPGAGSATPSITPGPSDAVPATGRASPAGAEVGTGRPPAAYLQGAGLGDPGAAGSEGSFTWNGFGSDAPWIVHTEPVARGAGPWNVALDPRLPVERWSARWAPVRNGAVDGPSAGATGAGAAIVVQAPGAPGTWSLQVEAWFGAGRRAAWFWTVDVLP